MSGVRPLRRADLPRVCALFEENARAGGTQPPAPAVNYLARTLLDHPWADPAIPSLVFEDTDGEILGCIGSNPRRLRLDGRPLLMACTNAYIVAPQARGRGVGTLLLERYFAGPQDVTLADAGNKPCRRIWTSLGAHEVAYASIGWQRVLRPGRAAVLSPWLRRRPRLVAQTVSALAPSVDTLSGLLPPIRSRLAPSRPDCSTEVLTAEALTEQVGNAHGWLRLHPDYDASFLNWVFGELDSPAVPGRLARRLVRGSDGGILGWYIYYLTSQAVAQVLQIGLPAGKPEPVFDHLLWHANQSGAVAVEGRVEPSLLDVLRTRRCALRPTAWTLIHTEDQTVLALLGSPHALLSRLEGGWWMGHLQWQPAEPDRPVKVPTLSIDR